MNYHIMVQDKFIDSYIEDVYALGQSALNVFWLRGLPGDTNYIHTQRNVSYIGSDAHAIRAKLACLNPEDNLFIHWYDHWIAEIISPFKHKLFVYFWGGELLSEPHAYHLHWLYDPKTLTYEKKQLHLSLIWRKNVLQVIKQYLAIRKHKALIQSQYLEKQKQIARIDYIISADINTGDIQKVKQLFPACKAVHLPGFYDVNVDVSINRPTNKRNHVDAPIKLLLGNSATSTNNHLDAFEQLSTIPNILVYCPLSYGNEHYRELIIAEGYRLFKDRFIPLVDFMEREQYIDFVNEMDAIVMFHNRSQAFGNIITALCLGKPVFMKPSNSLKYTINNMGIINYDATQIDTPYLLSSIQEAATHQKENNEKLKYHFSNHKRLHDLNRLLTQYT